AQQRMQLPVMAAMLAGIVAAAAGAGDAGIAAIAGTQAAAIQNQLRFSRQNEQEADRVGVTNMVRAGYDPRSMPNMFERLARQYRYDGKPPEFLLTHPVTESRIADTRNRAEQYPQGGKEDSLRYQQMRARTQLLFEETPGMAGKRFRAMLNDNPKLDAARYGLAISQTRIGQLNDARDNLRQLLAKAPNDVAYNLAQVELDITANRLPDADQRLKKMLAQFPSSYPLKQVRADLMLKMGKPQESEKILDDLSKARPLDPDVWNRLAEVRSLTNNAIGVHQARAEYLSLTGDYQAAIEQLDFAKRRAGGNFQLAARLDARQQEIRQQEKMVKEMFR
ncbi:tetratricopeptide repeat protein, partial [Pseudomonas aeruginosa]